MLTPEQERWAEASTVLSQHGDAAPAFIAERIGALALQGDEGGVSRWRAIATRVDQLRRGTVQ